jgi:glycosyltransferase involved in cell wall biosynthesis
MKILMLTPYLPYPLWSGGQIRTYNLLKNLSQKHEITLFSFIRSDKEKEYIPVLRQFCKEVQVFKKRPPWTPTSLILAALTFYPLVVCMYLNRQVKKAIAQAISEKHFDLIHAETFYVMPNIPKDCSLPVILVEQTIEYLVYQHFTQMVKFWPKKIIMLWDVFKIKFWERKFWQKAIHVVAMSNSDKDIMQKLVPDLNVDLVPNGVDTEFFPMRRFKKKKGKTVLFIGNFKWLQNREAVSILISQVWPEIRKKIHSAKLWIVGRSPSNEIKKVKDLSIKVSDNIDDIRKAYLASDVLLAPIYGPGGTRYKILESMATGLPVVTTSTGIEGLGAKIGSDVLVCDDPQGLAQCTVNLLNDEILYNKLAFNGRKLVENTFNWKSIADKLHFIYLSAGKK